MTLPMARSTCRQGQYGGVPDPSTAIPTTQATSRSAANFKSSSPIRVLPIPGSPRQRTIRGRRSSASSRKSRNALNSWSRPTYEPRISAPSESARPYSAAPQRMVREDPPADPVGDVLNQRAYTKTDRLHVVVIRAGFAAGTKTTPPGLVTCSVFGEYNLLTVAHVEPATEMRSQPATDAGVSRMGSDPAGHPVCHRDVVPSGWLHRDTARDIASSAHRGGA